MKQVTRREMLKRGAVTGVAIAWATPVIQTVSMSKAFAQTASDMPTTTTTTEPPPPATYYAVKIEPTNNCVDISGQTNPTGAGQCLDVDAIVTPVAGGCAHIASINNANADNKPTPWEVVLEDGCTPLDMACYIKTGGSVQCQSVDHASVWDAATNTLTFPHPTDPATGELKDISHVEIVICCEM
ncbi:MAG: hypothetical protein HKN07_05245 [Acidimicrobiia bacterium]|nr:hypothetical protein [Acidimicrobiia bacterium]NNF63647.1 hypothetical protein [Acidimicrobiia bacterium]